jgi:hypothetical protein
LFIFIFTTIIRLVVFGGMRRWHHHRGFHGQNNGQGYDGYVTVKSGYNRRAGNSDYRDRIINID